MSKPTTETIYLGAKFQLLAIIENGRCHVREFIDSLNGSEQKKMYALLKSAADNGPPKNEEKFKKLNDDELFEFKDFQRRIFCTFDKGKLIVLTHGFIKKSKKTPKSDIKRAKELLKLYREER